MEENQKLKQLDEKWEKLEYNTCSREQNTNFVFLCVGVGDH